MFYCFSSWNPATVGQTDPKPVLPGQQLDWEDSCSRTRVDGQAHGGRNDTIDIMY